MFKVHNQCDGTYWPFDFENISRRGFYINLRVGAYGDFGTGIDQDFADTFTLLQSGKQITCPNQVLKTPGGPADHKATTTDYKNHLLPLK